MRTTLNMRTYQIKQHYRTSASKRSDYDKRVALLNKEIDHYIKSLQRETARKSRGKDRDERD